MEQKKSTFITLAVIALLGTGYHFLWSGKDVATDVSENLTEGVSGNVPFSDLLELPYSAGDSDNEVIAHSGFMLSYNNENREPDWMAYELLSSEISNEKKERVEFTTDPSVKGKQANDYDYPDSRSEFSRGHMAPAADMKWSEESYNECFRLSNICPQNRELNAGAWNDLEKQVRREAKFYGRVWVVCGPCFDSKREVLGNNEVRIPSGFFKAILAEKKDGSGYVSAGFLFPNTDCKRNLSLYVMSVDSLETQIGMDLFHNLDDSLENIAESTVRPYDDWRITDKTLYN